MRRDSGPDMREAGTSWGWNQLRPGSPDPVWPRLDPDPTIITGVGGWPESPSPGDLDHNQPGSEILPQSGRAALPVISPLFVIS